MWVSLTKEVVKLERLWKRTRGFSMRALWTRVACFGTAHSATLNLYSVIHLCSQAQMLTHQL